MRSQKGGLRVAPLKYVSDSRTAGQPYTAPRAAVYYQAHCRTAANTLSDCHTRTAAHYQSHCRTLLRTLPQTAAHCRAHCCTQRTATHCRTAAHCHTATHALLHCRTHCTLPIALLHTAARTGRSAQTLPCLLPHAATHYRTLPRALPHTATCTAAKPSLKLPFKMALD
jgi:hypothetical protein